MLLLPLLCITPLPLLLLLLLLLFQSDPDLIRNELPEIEGYIQSNPQKAGILTHKEAG